MANDKIIKEIADKLQNHGSQVNPQMWQAVSSQIGAASTGAAGASVIGFGKVAAIVIGTTAIAVASYFAITSTDDNDNKSPQIVQVQKNEKTTNQKNTKITQPIENVNDDVVVSSQEDYQLNPNLETEIDNIDPEFQTIEELEIKNPSINEIVIPVFDGPVQTIGKTADSNPESKINKNNPTTTEKVVNPTKQGPKADVASSEFGITNLPNVFSPNNDGANDLLLVKSKGLSNYSLVVLDKNNTKIWQTTNPNEHWDGRGMSGEIVPAGEYIYFVAADGPNGEKVGKYQRLTITK